MASNKHPHESETRSKRLSEPETAPPSGAGKRIPRHEREGFSLRLKSALRGAGMAADSPTLLARKLNQSFLVDPITVQTATNWLHAKTMPTETATMALAQWLGVTHAWLRYGDGQEPSRQKASIENLMPDEIWLVEKWRMLPLKMQLPLRELLKEILAMQPESAGKAVSETT